MLSQSCLSPSLAHVSSRSSVDISRGAHIVKLNSHAECPQRRVVLRRCRCVHALCNTLILDPQSARNVELCCCRAGVLLCCRCVHAFSTELARRVPATSRSPASQTDAFERALNRRLHVKFSIGISEVLRGRNSVWPTEFLVQETSHLKRDSAFENFHLVRLVCKLHNATTMPVDVSENHVTSLPEKVFQVLYKFSESACSSHPVHRYLYNTLLFAEYFACHEAEGGSPDTITRCSERRKSRGGPRRGGGPRRSS